MEWSKGTTDTDPKIAIEFLFGRAIDPFYTELDFNNFFINWMEIRSCDDDDDDQEKGNTQ